MSLLQSLTSITRRAAKRVGRGYGSGKGGHTSGRGQKGQTSRQGKNIPLWFEGGQLPLVKRLPMQRGKGRFVSLQTRQEVQLKAVLRHGLKEITPETLHQAGLIRRNQGTPRLVGAVVVPHALQVSGVQMSKPVQAAIEKAGGTVSL